MDTTKQDEYKDKQRVTDEVGQHLSSTSNSSFLTRIIPFLVYNFSIKRRRSFDICLTWEPTLHQANTQTPVLRRSKSSCCQDQIQRVIILINYSTREPQLIYLRLSTTTVDKMLHSIKHFPQGLFNHFIPRSISIILRFLGRYLHRSRISFDLIHLPVFTPFFELDQFEFPSDGGW